MSNRSGAGGYKGDTPAQFFASYPAALNVDETLKPTNESLFPGASNQPVVLGGEDFNTLNRNMVMQVTVDRTFTGSDRGSFFYIGPSGHYYTQVQNGPYAYCPYGGGTGYTKHRINIDFGSNITLNGVIFRPYNDTGGVEPGVFGTTTSLMSTTGTNIVNENFVNTGYVIKTFANTTSRYWFLECNFPSGAPCGGCGSQFYLSGVRTSDNIWLPVNNIPKDRTKAFNEILDTKNYYFVNPDITTLTPDPWTTRQTTSTIYTSVRSPNHLSGTGLGIIQISGIATDDGRPYIGQTISGATSGATGTVRQVDSTTYTAYADIASGAYQSATIHYDPTSIATFTTGEKIYSVAPQKPTPKLEYGDQPAWVNRAVMKCGSGVINGSGTYAPLLNNDDWYTVNGRDFYLLATGVAGPQTSNNLAGFTTALQSYRVQDNYCQFYTLSGTVLTSGQLNGEIQFGTGSGYVDLDYRFSSIYEGASLQTASPIQVISGGYN